MAPSFREILKSLEYAFNAELELRHISSGEPFKFINQPHYERVADAVAGYIQDIMVEEYGMQRVDLPLQEDLQTSDATSEEGDGSTIWHDLRCPIFVSANAKTASILLILLCGAGRVSAGQWARRLCINQSLKTGSVLPFLDWAKEHDMAVVVLNPNLNFVETETGTRRRIPFNESAEAHVKYAWDSIIGKLPAQHMAMVAHSMGGVCACSLLDVEGLEVVSRLRCIALTDSIHGSSCVEKLSPAAKRFWVNHCVNWVCSCKPLDALVRKANEDFLENSDDDAMEEAEWDSQLPTRLDEGLQGLVLPGSGEDNSETSKTGCSTSFCEQIEGNTRKRTAGRKKCGGKAGSQRKRMSLFSELNSFSSTCPCDCMEQSAGTTVHEESTMAAFHSVCRFISQKLQSAGIPVTPFPHVEPKTLEDLPAQPLTVFDGPKELVGTTKVNETKLNPPSAISEDARFEDGSWKDTGPSYRMSKALNNEKLESADVDSNAQRDLLALRVIVNEGAEGLVDSSTVNERDRDWCPSL